MTSHLVRAAVTDWTCEERFSMSSTNKFSRIVGVYNASGSLIGEISYMIGKMTGSAHCALCDITHKGLTEKGDFVALRRKFNLELLHLNELEDEELEKITEGKAPCIVGKREEDKRWVILIESRELGKCDKDVGKFHNMLEAVLEKDAGAKGN